MEIGLILLILLWIGIRSKWEKYDDEKRCKKYRDEQRKRGLYHDSDKL
jgi:hypothetical protein